MPEVATCLRMVRDTFPNDEMYVNELVNNTLLEISCRTNDTESFVKVITTFNLGDAKPLVSIRYRTLTRKDAVSVLKGIMKKSPGLITGDLPNWIASHSFGRNSNRYLPSHEGEFQYLPSLATQSEPVREEAFQYLTAFASQGDLTKALYNVERNGHYKENSVVLCCKSHKSVPERLADRIDALLELVKARNARIKNTDTFTKSICQLGVGLCSCDSV